MSVRFQNGWTASLILTWIKIEWLTPGSEMSLIVLGSGYGSIRSEHTDTPPSSDDGCDESEEALYRITGIE